jgi:hypothetical protein
MTGGIDDAGGVYFAVVLCGGTYLGACDSTEASGSAFIVAANNWAIEGWHASTPTGYSYLALANNSGTTIFHHIAFINDIAANSDDGFGTGDGGKNHNVPGNGIDEFAVVGTIAYNANNDPICVAAVDDAGPANNDSSPGTHVFWAGVFAINNIQRNGCITDGEGMMFDTWDAHGYTGQGVIEQSAVWLSARFGLNIFYQGLNKGNAPMFVFNNTFFANDAATVAADKSAGSNLGDINIQSATGSLPYPIALHNNIVQTNYAYVGGQSGGGNVYALGIGGSYNVTVGGSGLQNIFYGMSTHCPSVCAGSDSVESYGNSLGTNIYESAGFKNTADLLANQSGTPNCSAYTNVTACMGWNGSSARNPSPIYDLTATASGTAGNGYQPPGPCTADPYFPTWLKGVVYLQWNGSSITENSGLITKPCGM